jgi:hypothetical protein
MNRRFWIGQWLLVLAIAATPAFQVSVDWHFMGRYHIFDDQWHPHAKYHLIVYHVTLILFSAAAIYGCLGRWRAQPLTSSVAAFSVVGFWVPYYVAALCPMASPYASETEPIPGQLIVGAVLVGIALSGWAMTRPPRPRGVGAAD